MRRSLVLLAICGMLAACGADDGPPSGSVAPGDPPASATNEPPTITTSDPPPPSDEPSPSNEPSPTPEGAVVVETDADVEHLDPGELAPDGTEVTGSWVGTVDGRDVIVVAVAGKGDAFARDRAVWRWTPAPDLGGWLGVQLAEHPRSRGVLGLDAVVTDVTGDDDDDALVFALTGGSGACGTWTVFDLVGGDAVFSRDLCDATIDPSTDPVGLLVTESVYRPGDPHCCPSARRESVLTYEDDRGWAIARRELTAL